MGLFGFYFINFMVSFISDIILNDISTLKLTGILTNITALLPYFKKKFIIEAAFYAGLTIIVALVPISVITHYMFNFKYPTNYKQLQKYVFISFLVGYILDILIEKLDIFGDTLKPFFDAAGAGLWGAIALVFSIVVSYILHKYLLPLL